MTRGKSICNVLKTIRTQIAKANDIKYEPRECRHTGECRGTCPACEAEVRYIERQLDIRRQLGKAVTIVGISAGLSALSACGDKAKKAEEVDYESLTVGQVLVEPVERLSGEVDNQDTEGIATSGSTDQTEAIKKRTAKFKMPKKTEKVESVVQESDELYEGEARAETLPLIIYPKEEEDNVFGVVEQMPMFRGGTNALMDYLAANIQYPEEMEEICVQGRVIVTFVVEKDGSIAEAKIAKSVHPILDDEALRVVNTMPKWNPGKQNGVSVRMRYTLPITFRLQ